GEDQVLPFWNSTIALIQEAAQRNLHIWADDRALGFLLWQYEMPISGPAMDAAVRSIRARFKSTSLLSTEMVLERLESLPSRRTAQLGWKLFTTGYRPLLGRLALRHLLADYGAPFTGAPYNRFLATLGALSSFLPPESVLSPDRRTHYVNIATVPILDALLDVVWNEPGLSREEREALGNIILDACLVFLKETSSRTLGLSVARMMLSMSQHREQHGEPEAPPDAEAWLGNALADRLEPGQLHAVALAIEDMAIMMYRGLHARALQDEDDEDVQAKEIVARLSARIAWQRLVPLFASQLLQVHAPVVRRVLAVLAGVPEAGQATLTIRRGTDNPLDVKEEEMEIAALNAFFAARDTPGLQRLLGLTRVQGVWNRTVPTAHRDDTENAPETHPVEVNVPYLTLALRDDDDLREAIVAGLAYGLDLVDPALRESVRDLHSGLVAEDPETRAHSIDRLADAAIGSVALDLERGLAHTAERLRDLSLDSLNAWLFNPVRNDDSLDHPGLITVGDSRYPRASLAASTLVSLTSSHVESTIAHVAQHAISFANEERETIDDVVTRLGHRATTEPNSAAAIFHFLILLHIARDYPDSTVHHDSASMPVREWARTFIEGILSTTTTRIPLRASSLKNVHAYVLRLALHACSSPEVLAALHKSVDEDDTRLAAQWTTNVLVASDRLLAFAEDRYRDPHELAFRLRESCKTLGFRLDIPGRTFDRFNPTLFGPDLIDHERWLLLHALDVSLDHLLDGDRPLWWTETVGEALRHLVEHPEPHEDHLLDPEVQNGLGMTMELPPSKLAEQLIRKAGSSADSDDVAS
ncbi:MAG: hypothetical protein AAGN64_07560, partial [Bacteroidota bacterium]